MNPATVMVGLFREAIGRTAKAAVFVFLEGLVAVAVVAMVVSGVS